MPPQLVNTMDGAEFLQYLVDGFHRNWPCALAVVAADTKEYVFVSFTDDVFRKLYQVVDTIPEGRKLLRLSDGRYAEMAAGMGTQFKYVSDIGVTEIAAPVDVDGKHLAILICRVGRSPVLHDEKPAMDLAISAANIMGALRNEFLYLWEQLPMYETLEVDQVCEGIGKIADRISNLVHDHLEVRAYRRYMELKEQVRLAVSDIPRTIEDSDEFWLKITDALRLLTEAIKAQSAVLLLGEGAVSSAVTIKAIAGLPQSLSGHTYREDQYVSRALRLVKPEIHDIRSLLQPNTFVGDIFNSSPSLKNITSSLVFPLSIDSRYQGAIVFMILEAGQGRDGVVTIDQITDVLEPAVDRISAACRNSLVLSEYERLAHFRGEWSDNFSHQIMAPITGIQGHTENLRRWLNPWLDKGQLANTMEAYAENSDYRVTVEITARRLQAIDRTLESIIAMTQSANRLARNFAWIGRVEKPQFQHIPRDVIRNMVAVLVGIARDFQELARVRRLRSIHVDDDSVGQLNGKVAINRILLSQVLGNLLDNAVKYSDEGTEVVVTATVSSDWGFIKIANQGIPILEDEVEKIFERGFRTPLAMARYPVGTGLGLAIAREIVALHGGDLRVASSQPVAVRGRSSYETVFQVVLPLIKVNSQGGI